MFDVVARSLDTTARWTAGLCLVLLLGVTGLAPALANPRAPASLAYLSGEYKLPASVDPTVAPGVATELWAKVYRPQADGRYPLIVFLHGNHGTCGRIDPDLGIRIDDNIDYTTTGTCPEGWVPTPNHLGYDYLATELASQGYVVVSINANRGVNAAAGVRGDYGLNLRRGRLVLRHLQQLADWNAGRAPVPGSLGFGLQGLIDFTHVGLMGHSRGGEGMRAALAQYRDRKSPWPKRIGPMNVEAVFEIGPVDGQTARILDADGVAWNVLLPACDGDVSDLEGVRPFDRMIMRSAETVALPKSSIQVFGANHNFYNSEWQESDSDACPGQPKLFPAYPGSDAQRQTALNTLVPFFRAHVGAAKQAALADRFDPSRPVPAELDAVTYYARGQAADLQKASNLVIDDFTRKAGRSSRNARNLAYGLDSYSHGWAGWSHDRKERAATVAWSAAGAYLQVNASNKGLAIPPGLYRSLEFRVKLECYDALCAGAIVRSGDVDFSIRLASGDGGLSAPVRLSSVAAVYRPVGAYAAEGEYNSVFQTVRIPLTAFAGTDMSSFRGVRFTFDAAPRGRLSFGNVRLVAAEAAVPGSAAPQPVISSLAPAAPRAAVPERNMILAVRHGAYAPSSEAGAGTRVAEIELGSSRAFPVSDALPTLVIGDRRFSLSRFAPGRLDRLIFAIDEQDYRLLPPSAEMTLVIGARPAWRFGTFVKR